MKKLLTSLATTVSLAMVTTGFGQVILNETFDYADDAALQAAWTTPASLTLDASAGNPSPAAAHSGANAIHQPMNLSFNITPTAANPLLLRADIYSSGTAQQANTVGLRTGANPLFEMGMYRFFDNVQTGPTTTAPLSPTEDGIGVRLLNLGVGGFAGQSWIKFDDNYTGWARWEALFTDVTTTVRVDLDIDGVWDYEFSSTRGTPIGAFTDIRFGAPSAVGTSATGFLVDNIYLAVIPEPSSLALSLLGGFGLLAMFRRRR
ncbi:MAG: PEP-CTERM sorting domain-containing protein [Verrucomicrobia bacterium]|jgi:hypothetical protein|nr:PEP-CTERM sorting domain-containing protein [Verrucomicrobiota bacterium]